jgi:hypothetical protein
MTRQNALPAFFLISGICLAANVASPFCFQTGTLLILVACLIWMRRFGHH